MAVFLVLHSFIHLVLMALFIWGFGWGVSGAIASNLGGGAICLAIILIYLHRAHGIRWTRLRLAHSKEMLSYGLRNYFGKISNKTDKRIGAILLAFFATKEEIGLFSIAYILTAKVMVLPDTLSSVLMPRIAANQRTRHPLVAKCVRLSLVICGAALLLLVLAVEPIVRILFSSEFLPAVPLIQILAIGMLLRSASKVFVPYLKGTNHPGTASLSVFVGTITNLAFLWFLLPVLGLSAAAWGVTASYIVSASILLLAFRKISGMSISHIARFESSDWTEMRTHTLAFARRLWNRIGPRVDPTTGTGL
jgi:O-antigen/teichoic acid export membrane protein